MDVNLLDNMKPPAGASSRVNVSVTDETVKEETSSGTKILSELSAMNDNDLLASLPKAEVKLKKLDETKLLMDNNENSLSVDTLIEILSSSNTDAKLPILDDIARTENCEENGSENNINVPPLSSAPSTLSSPSSSSASSKTGLSSPNSETLPTPGTPKTYSPPKKFPSPYSNGGKPMMADLNKKMKEMSKRRAKPKAVYQSQISDNSVGIKLCIKKSVNTFKTSPNSKSPSPRKRSRKSKTQLSSKGKEKGCESDSDDSYVKKRKKPSVNNNNNTNKSSFEEPVEQSGWGKLMPKEVLSQVGLWTDLQILWIKVSEIVWGNFDVYSILKL